VNEAVIDSQTRPRKGPPKSCTQSYGAVRRGKSLDDFQRSPQSWLPARLLDTARRNLSGNRACPGAEPRSECASAIDLCRAGMNPDARAQES